MLTTALLVTTAATGWGQTTVNFDTPANWTLVGSGTSYSTHSYSESGATFQGTDVIQNTITVQDGFPGALGTYSFRLKNVATGSLKITIATGGVGTFSFKVRRWDNSPMPDYTVQYSVDGEVSWNDLTHIDGTLLTTSDWFTYNGTINSTADNVEIKITNTGTTERIMIDDFSWTSGAPDTQAPVATFNPANTATGVSSSATPTITFDEAIHNTSDGSLVTDPTSLITFNETDGAGAAVPFTAAIDPASKVITVTPTSSLTPGQLYYLAIAPVQDAAGNATVAQSITFTTAATLSTETDITGFTLAGVDGTIDATNHTVSVVLPYGTNVTALEPTITLSQGATVSPTGAQDFTNPVTYTVTAEDGATTQPWVATVTFSAPEFTATYPKSANIGKNQFDVVVNLMSAAKVYYMMLASGSTAPTSAEVKAANNVIDVTAAATDYPVTISGLDANTTYDVYFVTEDNGGTILMDTPVKLSVTTSAGTLSIHDVQYTTDPSGASTYNNNIVTLNGTVTAIKNTSAGAYSGFYMQDAAGAWNGIYVYTSTYTVTPGDNVSVTGTVVEYKSNNTYLSTLTEISSTSDVTIISSGNTLPEATLVSTLDANSEAYESVLVKVENATCTGNPSTGTFTVDDGTGVLNLYKALFPTLALTTGTVYNVTGIMTDYSNATIQMYELYPRDANDVTLATGIGQNSTEATQVFPNPFTSNFTVNSGKVVSTVSIYNLLGQKLMERSYSATEVTVPAANLTNGIYIVNVRFQDGSAATLRMVKK